MLVFYFISLLLILQSAQYNCQGCNIGSECPAGYCCVSNIQPIGKRQLIGGFSIGTCTKMPTTGDSCLASNFGVPDYLNSAVFSCPCLNSKCQKDPNGYYIVPIGYSGTCV